MHFYVAVPGEVDPLAGRSGRTPGAISFFGPRPQSQRDGDSTPSTGRSRASRAAGMILLWPAFLHHLVHSNLSQTPRVSIFFNVVLKQSNAHLPRQ